MNRLERPIVLSPDTQCQNWVSKNNFDLNEDLTVSFKLKSIANEDKEFIFGLFLADSEDTEIFGGTTIRGGILDYSTKGEIGEAINFNDDKFKIEYKEELVDLLLDHVYPTKIESLVKNQFPLNAPNISHKNSISIVFFNKKEFLEKVLDYYNNFYFDALNDTTGVKDLITKEPAILDNYSNIILIQAGKNIFITEFKDKDNELLDINNIENSILRFSFEGKGKVLKIDILKPYQKYYKPIISATDINLSLEDLQNLKFGYSFATPIISYDDNKKADFKIVDFHVQGKIKN